MPNYQLFSLSPMISVSYNFVVSLYPWFKADLTFADVVSTLKLKIAKRLFLLCFCAEHSCVANRFGYTDVITSSSNISVKAQNNIFVMHQWKKAISEEAVRAQYQISSLLFSTFCTPWSAQVVWTSSVGLNVAVILASSVNSHLFYFSLFWVSDA